MLQTYKISMHYLRYKDFKLVMEMCSNKERFQMFKNNKLITSIYINDENLFFFKYKSNKRYRLQY